MNVAALLRPLLLAVVAMQAGTLTREQGLGMALGTLLLSVVVGRALVPLARTRPLLETLIYCANAAVALVNLLVQTPSVDLLCLICNVVLLLLLLDDPWVGWGRRLSGRLKKAGFRLTRPVVAPPT